MAVPPSRRRLGRLVLALLVLVHLAAFGAYTLRARQAALLQVYLDAREQWRAGRLAVAAAEYGAFIDAYAASTRPAILYRGFPDLASAWFALGRVEAERGRVEAALAAWRRSMALAPGRGRHEFRDLLLDSGRAAELESFARAELASAPGAAAALGDLGAALLALDRPGEAAAAYAAALAALPALLAARDPHWHGDLSSEEAQLLNLLAVARLGAGDAGGAARACDGLHRRQPSGARLDRLCRAYLRAAGGDRDGARAELAGYQPPAPEQEALRRRLEARLAP